MKLLAIVGSARKNGNTARITQLMVEQVQLAARSAAVTVEVEWVWLGDMRLDGCRGCRVCFDRGEEKCPLGQDDVASIKTKMLAADALIVSAPVYVDDINGITKTWIDRLAHLCHRPELAGKYAYLLTTVAISPTGHALATLRSALNTWGAYIVGQAGFKTGALMKVEDMRSRYQARIRRAALDLVQAVQRERAANPSMLSLLTFKIQQVYWQRNTGESIDHTYWKEHGWTEPRCNYYIPHRANWLKVAVARGLGGLIAPFVS